MTIHKDCQFGLNENNSYRMTAVRHSFHSSIWLRSNPKNRDVSHKPPNCQLAQSTVLAIFIWDLSLWERLSWSFIWIGGRPFFIILIVLLSLVVLNWHKMLIKAKLFQGPNFVSTKTHVRCSNPSPQNITGFSALK